MLLHVLPQTKPHHPSAQTSALGEMHGNDDTSRSHSTSELCAESAMAVT
jgi:hypothetical protein